MVLPVAPARSKLRQLPELGGPPRPVRPALDASGVLPDCRVLDTLAVEMDVDLFTQTPAAAANELERLGRHVGVASAGPVGRARRAAAPRVLRPGACWRRGASCSTSRRWPSTSPHWPARPGRRSCGCNPATAQRLGLVAGAPGTVRTERGTITLPVVIADLPDGVVWLPGELRGLAGPGALGVGHGDLVVSALAGGDGPHRVGQLGSTQSPRARPGRA